MKKILLFRPGALGDTVITFRILELLKKNLFEVYFVGNSEYVPLIDYFRLGKAISFDHPIFLSLFLESHSKNHLLKDFIKDFDFIICIENQRYLYDRLKEFHNNTFYVKSQPDYLIPIHLYFVKEISKIVSISFKYQAQPLEQTIKEPILIHPGSGSKIKMWGVENFIQVIDFLLKKFTKITILEGPAEKGIGEKFSLFSKYLSFVRINNVISLAKNIKNHNFFIGNDSGITHLASYTGITGISIFGVTNPWLWCPFPKIVCLYEIKNQEISFPSTSFVLSYLESFI